MRALASAPVVVGGLVLAVLLLFGFAAWLIDRRQTGGTRGMHAAPAARSARPVRVIAGLPPWQPAVPPAPRVAPDLAPLPEVPAAGPGALIAPDDHMPAPSPDELDQLAEESRQAQHRHPWPAVVPAAPEAGLLPAPVLPPVPFTEQLPPSPALIRAHETRLEQLLTDAHMPTSTSPDWEQRPALPGYLLEQVGHDGDTAAAVDSMFTHVQAAAVAAALAAAVAALAGDGIAGAIRDGAL